MVVPINLILFHSINLYTIFYYKKQEIARISCYFLSLGTTQFGKKLKNVKTEKRTVPISVFQNLSFKLVPQTNPNTSSCFNQLVVHSNFFNITFLSIARNSTNFFVIAYNLFKRNVIHFTIFHNN